MNRHFTILLSASLFLSACDIVNPKEAVPAYLYIPSFNFTTSVGQGTNSQAITEVYVYANDQNLGTYDLPASVPVIADGTTNIKIYAGIKNNGISSTRIKYPFYKPFETNIDLHPLETDTVVPQFTYLSGIYIYEKDFEGGNFLVENSSNEGTFTSTNNGAYVFEGDRSGWGHLDAGLSHLYYRDDQQFTWQSGQTVFLELNYSSNNSFAVGFLSMKGGNLNKSTALTINPSCDGDGLTPVWKKIYIDYGYVLQQNAGSSYHQFYIEAIPTSTSQPVNVFLDNMKWVVL